MKEVDKQKIVTEFASISGSSLSEAQLHLRKFDYDLQRALNDFYQIKSSRKGVQSRSDKPKLKDISAFFEAYADSDGSSIGPEGISKLSEHLGIDPLDVIWLAIAQKCQCAAMGHFTLDEWTSGMRELRCSCVEELKTGISSLRQQIKSDNGFFRDLYMFSFKFSLDPGMRNLPLDTAIALWDILLPCTQWELGPKWLEFIQSENISRREKAITRDVWSLVVSFAREVPTLASLSRFDRDSGAWPIIFDDFYDFLIS
jgi:DCN1-like protein 1/2